MKISTIRTKNKPNSTIYGKDGFPLQLKADDGSIIYPITKINSDLNSQPESDNIDINTITKRIEQGATVLFDLYNLDENGKSNRRKANLKGGYFLILDIDEVDASYAKSMELLKESGLQLYFRYYSFSAFKPHKENNNIIAKNHRLVIKFDKMLTVEELTAGYIYLKKYFDGYADKMCFQPSRLFFGTNHPIEQDDKPGLINSYDEFRKNIEDILYTLNTKVSKRKRKNRQLCNKTKTSIKRTIKVTDFEKASEMDYLDYNYTPKKGAILDVQATYDIIDEYLAMDGIKGCYSEWRTLMLGLTLLESIGESEFIEYFISNMKKEWSYSWMRYLIDARTSHLVTAEAYKLTNGLFREETKEDIIEKCKDDKDLMRGIELLGF